MSKKSRERNFKRSSAQLAHVVNRMFTTLETKGILRTAPEEFMLTSLYKANDALAAEFFRTCRHELFFGKQYLEVYESMLRKEASRETTVRLSKKSAQRTAIDAQSVYGFRPQHPDTWYLSPWEFCQWFKAIALKCPSDSYPYSKWTTSGTKKRLAKEPEALVAGEDCVTDWKIEIHSRCVYIPCRHVRL